MRTSLLLISLLMFSTLDAGVYTWLDANGNTVFGDSPPHSNGAREVELPTLTVADSYFKKKKDKKAVAKKKPEPAKEAEPEATSYEHFAVKSPAKDEALRANNGNIMVSFDLQPALQEGHGLVVYLDGKQVASGAATVFSLQAVDRGSHSLFAVVHDKKNGVLKNTQAVKFNVLRTARR